MTVLRASRVETGDWQIDPAELHRVFPPAGNAVERRKTALEEQIKDLRQVSELLHDVRATGIMYETQSLAVRALRELLDNPDRDNWDELLAANRALIKAIAAAAEIATLRQKLAAACAATAQTGVHAGTGYAALSDELGRWRGPIEG
jgi:Ribonuclease G/E